MIEIAFLFLSFQRLRLEREQNRQILLDLETIDLWHKFHIRKSGFKASGKRLSGRETALLAMKSRWVFLPRAKF